MSKCVSSAPKPLKRYGQHFILDENVNNKIVRLAQITPSDTVIEIGPGPGGLTHALMLLKPKRLILIEKDKRFRFENAEIMYQDACYVDFKQWGDIKVVSNLPYNVSTVILIQLIHAHKTIQSMTLMFQKEVAQRIVAAPGKKEYGRLSIITQAFFKPKIVYNLPPSVFTPPPKVDSSVVYFVPIPPPPCTHIKLAYLTEIFFRYRRKTIRKILQINNISRDIFTEEELNQRPENISVERYCELACCI